MVLEKRKKWNNVVDSRGVATERIERNSDKGRCPLCLGEEEVKHILLECLETRNWRMKFLNEKWLNMKKEVSYRKILGSTNKDQIRNLGRYLDKYKCT
jgi:hypothetical protein